MGKNKKKVVAPVKAPVVETKAEEVIVPTTETSKESSKETKVETKADVKKPEQAAKVEVKPQVKEPVKPAKQVNKPIPSVKAEVVTDKTYAVNGLTAHDAILLASVNQTAIREINGQETPELAEAMRKMTAFSVVSANIMFQQELIASGKTKELGFTINDEYLKTYIEACAAWGITGVEALEVKPADGQTTIDFTEAKVPEEIVEVAKAENKRLKEATESLPELDPTKIKDTTELIAAVSYLLSREFDDNHKKIIPAEGFILAMNLIKAYCLISAVDDAAKTAVESKDLSYWAEQVFITTSNSECLRTKGMCRSLYTNAVASGNALVAHAIFHRMTSLNGRPVLPAETIAQIMPVLVIKAAKERLTEMGKDPEKDFFQDLGVKALYATDEKFADLLARHNQFSKKEAKTYAYMEGSLKRTESIVKPVLFTAEETKAEDFATSYAAKLKEIASLYAINYASKKNKPIYK